MKQYYAKSFCDQCENEKALVTEDGGKATYKCARAECELIIAVVDAEKAVPTPTTGTIN